MFLGVALLWPAKANAQGTGSGSVGATIDVNCPLDCKGGGVCSFGNSDFSNLTSQEGHDTMPFLDALNENGYHCNCPSGRTGVLCERKYESCNDGEHFCFHGGKCLSGIADSFGNIQHYCDCSDAVHEGKQYSGRFCEAEAIEICGTAAEYGTVSHRLLVDVDLF